MQGETASSCCHFSGLPANAGDCQGDILLGDNTSPTSRVKFQNNEYKHEVTFARFEFQSSMHVYCIVLVARFTYNLLVSQGWATVPILVSRTHTHILDAYV